MHLSSSLLGRLSHLPHCLLVRLNVARKRTPLRVGARAVMDFKFPRHQGGYAYELENDVVDCLRIEIYHSEDILYCAVFHARRVALGVENSGVIHS
jgi:hypothetical protein